MRIRMAPQYAQMMAAVGFDDIDRYCARLQCELEEVAAMWVPGVPVPAARTGGNGKRRFKDPKTALYQRAICDSAIAAGLPAIGIANDEAAMVMVHLFMPRTNERERARKRAQRIADESGPDVDNVAKSILDGMQLDGGPMRDDCRVCALSVERRLVGDWCGPGAVVVLARVKVMDQ